MAPDPKDKIEYLLSSHNDQLRALKEQRGEIRVKIEDYYQCALQELKLNKQAALDEEQKGFVQSKQELETNFLHQVISSFGADTVQKCLGDVCLAASENTLSTTSDSPPIMVSMPRVSLPQVLCN